MTDFILFIDTNILLDFYRAKKDVGLDLLDLIDKHKDKVITTYQVEMEFKKNRQQVILEALGGLKKPEIQWTIPAFLKKAKAVSAMKKSMSQAHKKIASLQQRTRKILANPTKFDPVYKSIQRLFRQDSPLNLSRDKEIRFTLRRLARKRFTLGYPPRKDKDTSIGDAVNWEWIIHCAKTEKKDVIIVSRDFDYGRVIGKDAYINDWLLQEFRERVRKKVMLMSKITDALRTASVEVPEEQDKEESAIIDQSRTDEGRRKLFFAGLEDAYTIGIPITITQQGVPAGTLLVSDTERQLFEDVGQGFSIGPSIGPSIDLDPGKDPKQP
ncbi:hypothetical protein ES708_10787 [subsurface metagenome]